MSRAATDSDLSEGGHRIDTIVDPKNTAHHLINVKHFPSETGRVHGDTSFALSRQGVFLTVMIAIGDMERKVNATGEEHYEFTVKPSHAGPTFVTVHVPSSTSIEVEGYDWAIGILNYRAVKPRANTGSLEGGNLMYPFFFIVPGLRKPGQENLLTIFSSWIPCFGAKLGNQFVCCNP
jgi:hypothetical protein